MSERLEASALQLPQQAAHISVHVGIAGAKLLDQAHRVDHGRMIAPAELAQSL